MALTVSPVTVTLHVALYEPAVAVMVAVVVLLSEAFIAVTVAVVPEPLTVTYVAFEEAHEIVFTVDGVTVAGRVNESPFESVLVDFEREMAVTVVEAADVSVSSEFPVEDGQPVRSATPISVTRERKAKVYVCFIP